MIILIPVTLTDCTVYTFFLFKEPVTFGHISIELDKSQGYFPTEFHWLFLNCQFTAYFFLLWSMCICIFCLLLQDFRMLNDLKERVHQIPVSCLQHLPCKVCWLLYMEIYSVWTRYCFSELSFLYIIHVQIIIATFLTCLPFFRKFPDIRENEISVIDFF